MNNSMFPSIPANNNQDSSTAGDFTSLVSILQTQANNNPTRLFASLIDEKLQVPFSYTLGEFELRVQMLAKWLVSQQAYNKPVLLLFPTGFDYLISVWACLYAGAVAVPLFMPRNREHTERLLTIIEDTGACLGLTISSTFTKVQNALAQHESFRAIQWNLVDQTQPLIEIADWKPAQTNHNSLAFIQYASGSTSEPRGVMLTHGNLFAGLKATERACQLQPQEKILVWTPLDHIMGLQTAVFQPVVSQLSLYLLQPQVVMSSPGLWLEAISKFKINVSGGPNFGYQWCAENYHPDENKPLNLSAWRIAYCSSEPVRAEVMTNFHNRFASFGFQKSSFMPGYGLTEGTYIVAGQPRPGGPKTLLAARNDLEINHYVPVQTDDPKGVALVSCGSPLPECDLRIVDPKTRYQLKEKEIGEIWISGEMVAAGYWKKEDETKNSFGAFTSDPVDGPFLRTGDLGFLLDNELYITGRLKELIIIRGLNFYPQDIEKSAIDSNPGLLSGAAAFSTDIDREERLVILVETNQIPDEQVIKDIFDGVRKAVAKDQQLPVQSVAILLSGNLPRTANGKLNRTKSRAAFLAPNFSPLASSTLDQLTFHEESRNLRAVLPIEEKLIAIAQRELNRTLIFPDDNFFEIGGSSLDAAFILSEVRATFGVDLDLMELFEHPSIEWLAREIERAQMAGAKQSLPTIETVDRNGSLPLSYSQERMWFLHKLQPSGTAYNMATALHLKGNCRLDYLQEALDTIVSRHEVLRTSFPVENGVPTQKIYGSGNLTIKTVDLRGSAIDPQQRMQELTCEPFDLTTLPLYRTTLLQLAEDEFILLSVMHHIITDAWSLTVKAKELAEIYTSLMEGRAPVLPPVPIQSADYAVWERQILHSGMMDQALDYWRKKLEKPPVLALNTDFVRPQIQTSSGALIAREIQPQLHSLLQEFTAGRNATPFMATLAAFYALLYRYTGQEDITVGVPTANRRHPATENLVASLVNTLVMRVNLEPESSFEHLLDQVRTVALEAFDHDEISFSSLVAELNPPRDPSISPFFQVMFNMINIPMPTLKFSGLDIEYLEVDRKGAQFDLSFTVIDLPDYHRLVIEYNTDLFLAETIQHMADHFMVLLQAALNYPDTGINRLPFITEAEQDAILNRWNATQRGYPAELSLYQRFETQAAASPEAEALVCSGQRLTYAQLETLANQYANALIKIGVTPEALIGICLPRSIELVACVLGILKAGCAYVPLDPAFPAERLEFMTSDADLAAVFTTTRYESMFKNSQGTVIINELNPLLKLDADLRSPTITATGKNLAYVIYTSGSTGKPKGVLIEQHAVMNFIDSMQVAPGFKPGGRLLSVTTLSFDIAGLELFLPLFYGGCVVLASDEEIVDGSALIALLENENIDLLQATPVTWRMMIEANWQGKADLTALCGGEALPPDLANQILERTASLWNMYGPTETTIWSTTCEVKPGQPITIGRPIDNTRVYVLDPVGQQLPPGVAGELFIGGVGVARGYLNRPELTSERFLKDPFVSEPERRMYRTGDLVRWLPDGQLEYLGRMDFQVKLHGHRIELGEIEAALGQHPEIDWAVVQVVEVLPGDRRLAAYLISADHHQVPSAELRSYLQQTLPPYMIPSHFMYLDEMPLTPNRKVNRKALPIPVVDRAEKIGHMPAVTETEKWLVKLWEELLNISPIGISENFFDLGGHSFLAIRMFAKIQNEYQKNLPLTILYESGTIQSLARQIDQYNSSSTWRIVVPLQTAGSKPPLFFVHPFDGDVVGFSIWARYLGNDQPLYGIRATGIDGVSQPLDRIEDIAELYIKEIRQIQPEGPYYLAGYCAGSVIVYEMALQLEKLGQKVGAAMMVNYAHPDSGYYQLQLTPRSLVALVRNLTPWLIDLSRLPFPEIIGRIRNRTAGFLVWLVAPVKKSSDEFEGNGIADHLLRYPEERHEQLLDYFRSVNRALKTYHPPQYSGSLTVIRTRRQPLVCSFDPSLGWAKYAPNNLTAIEVEGSTTTIIKDPHAVDLANAIKNILERVQAK